MEKLSDVVIEQACAQHAHETNRAFVSAVDAGISMPVIFGQRAATRTSQLTGIT